MNTDKRASTKYLIYILIILSGCLSYGLSLYNNFTYDDHYSILENPALTDFSLMKYSFSKRYFSISHEASYRPIITILNFIEFHFFGKNPIGYHAINILLHLLCSLLIFNICCILFSTNIAFLTALLHTIHPALSEAVVSISFGEDLLCLAFLLLTLYCMIQYTTHNTAFLKSCVLLIISICSFCFALLSKESALFFPFFWGCVCILHRHINKKMLINLIILLVLSALFILIRFGTFANPIITDLNTLNSFSQWFGLITYLPDYIQTYLIPTNLSIIHPLKAIPPATFISLVKCSIAFIFILGLIAYSFLRKRILAIYGLVWFITALLPVCGIIPLKFPFAERYIYIPSVGLALIIAYTLSKMYTNFSPHIQYYRQFILSTTLLLFSCLIICVQVRTSDWRTDLSLWQSTYKTTPLSPVVHYSLGKIYQEKNLLDKAEQSYKRSIYLNRTYLAPYMNLAVIYIDKKQFHKALSVNREILRKQPDSVIAHFNNGIIYAQLKDNDMELYSYLKAIKSDPQFIPAYKNLLSYYIRRGFTDKAADLCRKGIKKNYEWIEGYEYLYNYLIKHEKPTQALRILLRGIKKNPKEKSLRILYLNHSIK